MKILKGLLGLTVCLAMLAMLGCSGGDNEIAGTGNLTPGGGTPGGTVTPAAASYIKYTVPSDGDSGVSASSAVYIVFNTALNTLTATQPAYYQVSCNSISEEISIAYDASKNIVTISPASGNTWEGQANCDVTVMGSKLRNTSDTFLGADATFAFSTGQAPPSGGGGTTPDLAVDFTVPIDGATGVAVSESFYMVFNRALNPLTVVPSSFLTECGSATTKTAVAGVIYTYDSGNRAVVVKPPQAGWPGDQVCSITARANYIMDSANVALPGNQAFTFSTGAGSTTGGGPTDLMVTLAVPIPPADQIPVNTPVSFLFNKGLKAVTVVPTAFGVACNGQAFSGYSLAYSAADNSVKLTPPITGGWGNGAACVITVKKASLFAADDTQLLNDYDYDFSTVTASGITIDRLSLRADKYSVASSGSDSATLTVTAVDANGASIPEVKVQLSTDRGILSDSEITTDSTGSATFTVTADDTRANGMANVSVKTGVLAPVTVPIAITGTSFTLDANKTVTRTGLPGDIVISGKLVDSSNNPIALSAVTVTSSLGNTLTEVNPDATPGLNTDVNGLFTLSYTATVTGNDTITVSGFGASKTLTLTVTNASFAFTAPAQNTVINTGATQVLTVTWANASGAPVALQPVVFNSASGTVNGQYQVTVNTDATGKARVTYVASNIASPDTILASASAGTLSTSLNLDIRASNPSQLSVQATPSVIGIKTPTTTPTSTIIATVRDAADNPVAGQTVAFTLVAGAGGGEFLSPALAVTDSAGQAKTTLYSGTATSMQNGVTVRATLGATLSDTVNLTISSAAASIIFGTTNKISPITVDGYAIAYELPVSVLVTDINGGPIEGAPVSLGIYPTKFLTGSWSDDGTQYGSYIQTARFANEDLNRNAILDTGEDGAIGCWTTQIGANDACTGVPLYYVDGGENTTATVSSVKVGNGRLDPRNVATLPAEVLTNADGLATIKIKYPKSFCSWVFVEITGTTTVTGSETKAVYNLPLSCMAADKPYSSSPFGD